MKLISNILLLVASFTLLLPGLKAQELRESADPYYQPAGQNIDSGGFPERAGENSTGQFAPNVDRANEIDFLPAPEMRNDTSQNANDRKKIALTNHSEPVVDQQEQQRQRVALGQTFAPSRVLARVGGRPIFVSDLSVEAMQVIDKFIGNAPAEVKQQEVQKLLPRLLPKYIQAKLLLVDVLGSLPEGADVNEIYDSAGNQFDELMLPRLMENVKVKSPVELDAYYRALGSSTRKVKQAWVETELVKYMMRSKINVNPDVSHREIYEYYLANKDKYSIKARVNWEQVMVRFDRFPTREAAHAAISEMGNEIVHGAPFTAVAKRSSQGFKAAEGGSQGWTNRGSLVDKKLDERLFTIEPGKLSEIIQTSRGYLIIRVLERQEDGYVPFENAQSEIREQILSEKQDAEFQRYVEGVRRRVPVELFEPEFVAEQPGGNRR